MSALRMPCSSMDYRSTTNLQRETATSSPRCVGTCTFKGRSVQSVSQKTAPSRVCLKAASVLEPSMHRGVNKQPIKAEVPMFRGNEASTKPQLKLSWAGAGIYFFWQLGSLKYLAERYDLTKVPMVGASGGALAAILGGCGVPADVVLQHAYDLSVEARLWDRQLGLVGIWGSVIEQWLQDLLPDDAAEMCRGRVTLIVSTLPMMEQVGISDFKDKQDLINVAMASAHVPFVLDLKIARPCRGRLCVDGSFPDFFANDNSELLKSEGRAIIFDYFEDKNIVRSGRLDMLQIKGYDEIQKIMGLGYDYAAALHAAGDFLRFDLGDVTLPSIKSMEELS